MTRFMKYLLLSFMLLASVTLIGQTGKEVIAKSVVAHGGDRFESLDIEFNFRGKIFRLERDNGAYTYQRMYSKDGMSYKEVLTNNGFKQFKDGALQQLSTKDSLSRSGSINSVSYFTLMPFPLKDPAVVSKYLGEVTIKGKLYDKVQVTFKQEGGGRDYQDVFIYWFEKTSHLLDYLAYTYDVNGGGLRFRAAINRTNHKGLVVQDYINYKGVYGTHEVAELDQLFEAGQLQELSRIENKQVEVHSTK